MVPTFKNFGRCPPCVSCPPVYLGAGILCFEEPHYSDVSELDSPLINKDVALYFKISSLR